LIFCDVSKLRNYQFKKIDQICYVSENSKPQILENSEKKKFNLKQKFQKLFEDKIINEQILTDALHKNLDDLMKTSINTFLTLEIEEQIYLGFFNIAKKCSYFSLTNEFHLHKAIYENNIRKINDICKNER
jgi:hypothetical protein